MMTRKNKNPAKRPDHYWQLQEAKAMFSDAVRAAEAAPQFITVRGEEAAVLLSIDEYRELIRPKQSLYEFIRESPLFGVDLNLPDRSLDVEMRAINL